jgi:DNA-binding MurR/RpiR family transcriptional regulator
LQKWLIGAMLMQTIQGFWSAPISEPGQHPSTTSTIQALILNSVDSLTPTETRVAQSLLAGYPSSATRSSAAIATAAGASPASVLRFVAKLGFGSLGEFQEAVRSELDARMRSPFETYSTGNGDGFIDSVAGGQAANTQQTLGRLTPELITSTRTLLTESSTVFALGGRFSHALAWYLAAHLQLVRPGVHVLTQDGIAERLAHAGRGTCLVAFDFRRYQPIAESAAGYVKSRRGRVVLVTDPYISPVARHADRTLIADIEIPRLFDSYAAAVALLDTIIGDVVTSGGERSRRRIRRVEEARLQLDTARHRS